MKNNIIFCLLSAIILNGCHKEVEDVQNNESNAIHMSFYAGIEKPADATPTKTILDGNSENFFRSLIWEYQDEVYVSNGTNIAKFINTVPGYSDIALFEGMLDQASDYFAAYPYNMVKGYSSSGFNIELPSVQTYFEDGIASDSFPMVAKYNEGVFSFQSLCGILVLRLVGNETISSITFSGKDAEGVYVPVAGVGKVSMSYSDYPSMAITSSQESHVILQCPRGVRINPSTPTAFHIILPVGTYEGFEITIVNAEGSKMIVKSSKTLEIKRATRTTTASLTFVDSINLSDLGTSNCYIVSESGKYRFDASVKGNGTEPILNAVSAEVLWESYGTDVDLSVGDLIRNVRLKNGGIEFETVEEFAEGNAVIAAKDASGKILWSWHIWLTDQPGSCTYSNNAGVMMDRNLGATSAAQGEVQSLGLLYQWGRKDPFLGSSSINTGKDAVSTIKWPSPKESSSLYGTIEYSVQYPTTFITRNTYNNDWYYTGLVSTDNTRWHATKTMYDPCPMGWRVPNGGNDGVWSISGINGKSQYTNGRGVVFGNEISVPSTWYPASGSRSGSDGSLFYVGRFGDYWSCTPYSINNVYVLNFGTNGVMEPTSSYSRAYAHSVRCIKE